MKDYIKDDGEVRRCNSNLVKMNILEHCYFNIFHWKILKRLFKCILKSIQAMLEGGIGFIWNIISLFILPIHLIYGAYEEIKHAKKSVNNER